VTVAFKMRVFLMGASGSTYTPQRGQKLMTEVNVVRARRHSGDVQIIRQCQLLTVGRYQLVIRRKRNDDLSCIGGR
jgi:hypothetical protein